MPATCQGVGQPQEAGTHSQPLSPPKRKRKGIRETYEKKTRTTVMKIITKSNIHKYNQSKYSTQLPQWHLVTVTTGALAEIPDWTQQQTETRFSNSWVGIKHRMDRVLLGCQPLKKRRGRGKGDSLTYVIPQLYTEQDKCGTEQLPSQFKVTCPCECSLLLYTPVQYTRFIYYPGLHTSPCY